MNGKWKKPNIAVSRTGRQLDFRIPAGSSEIIRRYYHFIVKKTIFSLRPSSGLRTVVPPWPAGSPAAVIPANAHISWSGKQLDFRIPAGGSDMILRY